MLPSILTCDISLPANDIVQLRYGKLDLLMCCHDLYSHWQFNLIRI